MISAKPIQIAREHKPVCDACVERGLIRPEDRADIERVKGMPLEDVGVLMAESILRSVAAMNRIYLERIG